MSAPICFIPQAFVKPVTIVRTSCNIVHSCTITPHMFGMIGDLGEASTLFLFSAVGG